MSDSLNILNSFENFIEMDNMPIGERIRRDLLNYLTAKIGKAYYDRSIGSLLVQVENDGNDLLLYTVIKAMVVLAVSNYNLQTTPELQVIVGSEMVDIKQENEKIDIFVIFLPMQQPTVENIRFIEFPFK